MMRSKRNYHIVKEIILEYMANNKNEEPVSRHLDRVVFEILTSIDHSFFEHERKIDNLSEELFLNRRAIKELLEKFSGSTPIVCQFSRNSENTNSIAPGDFFPNLIIGDHQKHHLPQKSNISRKLIKSDIGSAAKAEATSHLRAWLTSASEVICIDPYIFKRSKMDNEDIDDAREKDKKHAEQLLEAIGKNKEVHFIYQPQSQNGREKKVSPYVANAIEEMLPSYKIKATFHAVPDLHDRVWLKKSHNSGWSAKVMGTSIDGIGKRPTYIIDMPKDDCKEYIKYVNYLKENSTKNHLRPTTDIN